MTETIVLKAEIREHPGTRYASRLRDLGKMPAVVYGHKEAPVSIALDARDFLEHLHHGRRVFEIEFADGRQSLLVKSLQYDYLGTTVIHADLLRVDLSERVNVKVPLDFRGVCVGSHKGGMLDELLSQIEIECPVMEIPQSIAVSVKELDIGDGLRAGQVELPAGCRLLTSADALLVLCHELAVVQTTEELETEAPVQPEVITERAVTEEEQPEKEKGK
jgi:large subunit ribosomal protein L25